MLSYIILNSIFLLIAIFIFGKKSLASAPLIWIVLIVSTLVFDNIIITMQFVDYDFSKTLGIIFYKMPVEDIFYSAMAVILMNGLWKVIK